MLGHKTEPLNVTPESFKISRLVNV